MYGVRSLLCNTAPACDHMSHAPFLHRNQIDCHCAMGLRFHLQHRHGQRSSCEGGGRRQFTTRACSSWGPNIHRSPATPHRPLAPCTPPTRALTAGAPLPRPPGDSYRELNEVHTMFKDEGLQIIGVPCNQFGAQVRPRPPPGKDLPAPPFPSPPAPRCAGSSLLLQYTLAHGLLGCCPAPTHPKG